MKPIQQAQSYFLVRPAILLMGAIAFWALPVFALDGRVQIHDPSTLMLWNGKYPTFGTGGDKPRWPFKAS